MLTAFMLVAAPKALATPQLCEPPVDPACGVTLNPAIPNCNPFTMTINNTDVTDFNDNPTSVSWTCRTNCAASPDWRTDCSYLAYTDGTLDEYDRWDDTAEEIVAGLDERRVSMVVNGIGVTLQYTDDGYDDGPTVLFHSGGGSNQGFTGGAPIRDFLRAYSNARTVNIKYEMGVALVGADDGGWQLRSGTSATDYPTQTLRTADMIAWIDGNLANSGEPFGTVACSFGTLATLAAPVWHGHDAIIDYQALIGGPPMRSVNAGCGMLGETYMDPYDADITADPEHGGVSLATGEYCNSSVNQCLTYWPVGSAAFVNHIHMLDDEYATTCLNSEDVSWPSTDDNQSALEASSWETVASPDWSLGHVVDFFMDRTVTPPTVDACDGTNGCPDNDYFKVLTLPEPDVTFSPSVGSDEVKAGPSAVRVYQALLDGGTTATWSWQEGDHCDSYQSVDNTPPVIDAVIMGLGVEAVRHELRVVKHEDNFTATDACLEYDAGAPENTFSDSETLTVNGREYRVGTYHDPSGSPELQATIASGADFSLPDMDPAIATVDRVTMLIAGSKGSTYEDLTVTFTYAGGVDSVTAQVPKDDISAGTYSGEDWDVIAWTGDVTGNGASCDDGAFEVRIRNPHLTAEVEAIEVTYGGDLAGPLALTILTDAATWDAVEAANAFASCQVTTPYTTACELEPVRAYWN